MMRLGVFFKLLGFCCIGFLSAGCSIEANIFDMNAKNQDNGSTSPPSAESPQITNPATPPTPDTQAPDVSSLSLNDGVFYNSLSKTPTLSWSAATDSDSGIDYYEIAVGSASGNTDIQSWTNVGNVLSYQLNGLSLQNGNTYFVSIRAKDKSGNVSNIIQGDGWTIETTAPTAPTSFLDGLLDFSVTKSSFLSWLAGSDAESGLQGYQIAIGDSAGGSNVLDWTNVGNVLSTVMNSLSLQGSKRYFASIRSLDNAGNVSSLVQGDGWWNFSLSKFAIDSTSPAARSASMSALFGSSAAVSEDQNTLVIGATGDNLDASGADYVSGAGAVFVYIKSGGTWVFQQKLTPSGTNARISGDSFGSKVAISGNTIAVSAPTHKYDANGANMVGNAGAVYIFTRSGSTWSQQQKIIPTGTNARMAGDNFGSSLAMMGDTLAAGTTNHDYDENGANLLSNAGAVFVFTRSGSTWSQQQKIVPTGTNARIASDSFGISVALGSDTLAVGASNQDYDESGANILNNSGAVFVYTRSGVTWSQQQRIVATGTNARTDSDNFGKSVSISAESLIVGAPGQSYDQNGANFIAGVGAAFVFTRSLGVWSLQQKLVPSGTNSRISNDGFGSIVSISGDLVIASTPGQDYDETGANLIYDTGAIYTFKRTTGVWAQEQKIVSTERLQYFNFGTFATLSGSSLVVGYPYYHYDASGTNYIPNAGLVYSYAYTTSWSQDQKLIDTTIPQNRWDLVDANYGHSVAISTDGLTMAVGVPREETDENNLNPVIAAGAVYVYVKSGGIWSLQQKIVATGTNARMTADYFGTSIALSGETLVVGAPNHSYYLDGTNTLNQTGSGAVFVYTRSGTVWTQQQKIIATGFMAKRSNDQFGSSVSINGDTLAVGSYKHGYDSGGANLKSGAGAVFVYTRSGTTWTQQQKITPADRDYFDQFGVSVSVDGNSLAIGANQHALDASGANSIMYAGAAYVYTRSGSTWSIQQKITPTGTSARNSNDNFGQEVVLSGDGLLISSPRHYFDTAGTNSVMYAGAVFVYSRSGTTWTQQQKIVPTGTNARAVSNQFGNSMSLNGNTLVIGSRNDSYDPDGANSVGSAGSVYVFSKVGSLWTQEKKLIPAGTNARNVSDSFGASVAVSENGVADGYTIVVGAPDHDYTSTGGSPIIPGAGAAFIFH